MNSKWFYIFALLLLPAIRVLVLNTDLDVRLTNMHLNTASGIILLLRDNQLFVEYMGNWALPVFVASALVFWVTEQDGADIPKQFLLAPIAYVPFSIVGNVLSTAQFHFFYLYVHPLIIIPFGYLYVSIWTIIVWLFQKIGLAD